MPVIWVKPGETLYRERFIHNHNERTLHIPLIHERVKKRSGRGEGGRNEMSPFYILNAKKKISTLYLGDLPKTFPRYIFQLA